MEENDKKESKKDWKLPLSIAFAGIIGSLIIGQFQICSTEKIALNERKMKMWELFSKDFLNVNYKEDVWKTEGSVRLLGAMLRDTTTLEDESLIKLARAVFEESIITSIGQFHRTEDIRISAARVVASMYHLDKKFVIRKLIEEIKPEGYPGYFRINGAVLIALAKIPDYWEGTINQKEKIQKLENDPFLGEDNMKLTKDYKSGWLKEAIIKCKIITN